MAGKVASTPEALTEAIRKHAPSVVKIGLETGPLCTWHWHALRENGLPVVCLDARHAKAALSVQLNKTDDNDAYGLAQLIRSGWYKKVRSRASTAIVCGPCFPPVPSWSTCAAISEQRYVGF
ncbi:MULTISPECIES: hypothetical protein [Mesorhizobium]|uniref:hypothetical protein n=1 Tax=Mesorhizobium TaxID=68287 RepID=UPI0002DFAAD2